MSTLARAAVRGLLPIVLGAVALSGAPPAPRDLLRQIAQLADADWAALERGEAVAKVLDTDTREVAIAGAVRIAGRVEAIVQRSRDIEGLERSALVLDAGRFSTTPVAADLRAVPLETYSLDLRRCRPGDCPVRLTTADIERFQRTVDWNAAAWREQAAATWRDVLAGHAAAYQARGRSGLPEYVNKAESLSVSSELGLLIREFDFIQPLAPDLYRYLQQLGPLGPAGLEQTLYWTKEDFGVRPILRISHQMIHRGAPPESGAVIATNQVYADHYLDAALGVTLTIDAGNGRDFYMVAVNRARTRSLSGFLRRFVRSTVQSRSRDAMRKILTSTKIAVERG